MWLQIARKRQEQSTQNFTPRPWQEEGISLILERPGCGLFVDPGLGKTSIVLFAFKLLKELGLVENMVVVASRIICYDTWPQEIKKWGLPFSYAHCVGPLRQRVKAVEERPDILFCNPENVRWLCNTYLSKGSKKVKYDMLAVDESTKFRNHTAKRFVSLKGSLKRFKKRVVMTGTPIPNGLLGLWGQMYIADLGQTLYPNVGRYRNEFFMPVGYKGYQWGPIPDALPQIVEKIAPNVMRADRDELDLPKLASFVVPVELPDEARKVYSELEKDFVTFVEGHPVTVSNAGTLTGKLRQLANGGLYTGSWLDRLEGRTRETIDVHDAKVLRLFELIDELGGKPCFIAFEFTQDIERIVRAAARYKRGKVDYISGKTKGADDSRLLKRWANGTLNVLFGQISSVAWGLNLQRDYANVIYFSMVHDLEAYEQFYQRIWRGGQRTPVFVYHLIAKDTIEEDIYESTLQKGDVQLRFLNAVKARYEETKPMPPKDQTRTEYNLMNGIKSAMYQLADHLRANGNKVPVYNEAAPSMAFLLDLYAAVSHWRIRAQKAFYEEVTGALYGYPDNEILHHVKGLVNAIFGVDSADPDGTIKPATYKMWVGGVTKSSSTAAKPRRAKTMTKKAPAKEATAKETPAKKVTPKKAAPKKAAPKKRPVKRIVAKTSKKAQLLPKKAAPKKAAPKKDTGKRELLTDEAGRRYYLADDGRKVFTRNSSGKRVQLRDDMIIIVTRKLAGELSRRNGLMFEICQRKTVKTVKAAKAAAAKRKEFGATAEKRDYNARQALGFLRREAIITVS